MTVSEAVEAELAAMDKRLPGVSSSVVAASALALAFELDDPGNSATSKSMCAKELREHMAALEARLPPAKTSDAVDDLERKRKKRQAAAAAG